MHELNFMQAVEVFFLQHTGVGVSLSSRDLHLLQRWRAKGAPVTAVLRGLTRAFERWQGRRPPQGLAFAEHDVERELSAYCRTHPGVATAPPAWADLLLPTYEEIKAQLVELGTAATSERVKQALRESYRVVLRAEREDPQPPAFEAWRTAREVAFERLEASLPVDEKRRILEGVPVPDHARTVQMSPRAVEAYRRQSFKAVLARQFGLESLMYLPRSNAGLDTL